PELAFFEAQSPRPLMLPAYASKLTSAPFATVPAPEGVPGSYRVNEDRGWAGVSRARNKLLYDNVRNECKTVKTMFRRLHRPTREDVISAYKALLDREPESGTAMR